VCVGDALLISGEAVNLLHKSSTVYVQCLPTVIGSLEAMDPIALSN
jgi:hypothetical protein